MNRFYNRKKSLPPLEDLIAEANRIYQYDEVNGGLVWKAINNPRHPGQAKIGQQVGGDDGHGYKMCMLLGHKFKVHQIVWLILKNKIQTLPLDHINRNRTDNRIENLREVTDQQNIFNQSSNVREYSGVTKPNKSNKFIARLQINGKKIFLGSFDTKEEAAIAYQIASKKLRGEHAANPV